MVNPPAGYVPAGWTPSDGPQERLKPPATSPSARPSPPGSGGLLWLLLFLNTSAGISVISQESPMFQELAGVTAGVAARHGRLSLPSATPWAASSGPGSRTSCPRRFVFLIMFLLQAVLFWILPGVNSRVSLTVVAFIILLCYGGGFGTMPAFAADYFGPKPTSAPSTA